MHNRGNRGVKGKRESVEWFLLLGLLINVSGLDVKTGTTGSHSIYQRWNGNEVMYHASVLLPFNHKDKQQLER